MSLYCITWSTDDVLYDAGNKFLLQTDEMWKKLIDHYDEQKKVVNASEFMT